MAIPLKATATPPPGWTPGRPLPQTAETVLAPAVSLTIEEELQALRAENARLKAAKPLGKLTLKVSQKGAISLYGLGRFPVTLYLGQWARICSFSQEILAFAQANRHHLATKD